uniref:Secreted protein n=1 Tax=Ixodes ricinus TaxID=34613 RepID=V5HBJ1_IXORI
MPLDIIMGVLLSWQTFVAPEPSRPSVSARRHQEQPLRLDQRDIVGMHRTPRVGIGQIHLQGSTSNPHCPQVTRHTFKTNDPRNPWVQLLSQYCERKPPEIPQPVMGTFSLYPRSCAIMLRNSW